MDRVMPPGISFRQRIWQIVETAESGDQISRIFDAGLIILILMNVSAVVLESVPTISETYGTAFLWFEYVSIIIFSIEYVLRLWSCVEDARSREVTYRRLRYLFRPSSMIDLLAIAPGIVQFFIPSVDLRVLRAIRILRIFKLSRYSVALKTMLEVFQSESDTLTAAIIVLFTTLLVVSTGIHFVEHNAQPEHFGTIPDSMWWALVTLTTVGYGDVTPITPLGKVFGGLVTIMGIGIVALPTGIIASSFSYHMKMRNRIYERRLAAALEDGNIDVHERQELTVLVEHLGLTSEQAKSIEGFLVKNYPGNVDKTGKKKNE